MAPNHNDLKAVFLVQEALLEIGIQTVLAGGAVRDIIHGNQPKDYDLICLGYEDNISEVAGHLVDKPYVEWMEPFGEGASMKENTDDNLAWVVKLGVLGTPIDLIQYADNLGTPEEVVESFDCTLNMCWLPSMHFNLNDIVKHPSFPKHIGDKVLMLPLAHNPKQRRDYIQRKYPQYLYETDAELDYHPNYEGARC